MKKITAILLLICMLIPSMNVEAASSIKIAYNGKTVTYTNKQLKATANGKNVSLTKTPGILESGYALLPYVDVFKKGLGVSTAYNSSNKTITMKYGSKTVKMTLNSKTATVNGVKKTMNVTPKIMSYKTTGVNKIVVPSRFVAENLGFNYTYNSTSGTVAIAKKTSVSSSASSASGFKIKYGGKTYTYTKKSVAIKAAGKTVATNMPGVIINNISMLPANATFAKSGLGASYSVGSDKKAITMKKGSNTLKMTLGSKTAYLNGVKKTMPEAAWLMQKVSTGVNYVMVPGEFVAKSLGFNYSWNNSTATSTITVKSSSGSTGGGTAAPNGEVKAMWISYLEYGASAKTEAKWKSMVDEMFDNCVSLGMDTVIAQVRPMGDAIYPSKYFPWSKYVSGTEGKDPGYDPFKYMVDAAHKRNLKIEAWINPYRVTLSGTNTAALSSGNQARKWAQSTSAAQKRNVLSYNSALYYNPSVTEVQNLIINGVKEIVTNYDVDGIHFDDYFYPTFSSSNVSTAFDAPEYKSSGSTKTIANWRRANVNNLVSKVYSAIKAIDSDVVFGISPAGNLNNLRSSLQYYVDIDTWMTKPGYVDYICPQIYWGFENGTYSYDKVLDQWTALNKNKVVDLYVGIATYKAGSTDTTEWKNNNDIMKRQVEYGRKSKGVSGYVFFRYEHFYLSRSKTEVNNLLKVIK